MVTVRGADELSDKLNKMYSRRGLNRIAAGPVRDSLRLAYFQANTRNWGFTDRTGDLRASLRMEQARDVAGRFATAWALVAATPYARFVEWKARTIDGRPGPPYWLNRAIELKRALIERRLAEGVETTLAKEARRL